MSSGKKAILVASYGTSYDKTREKTIGAIERHIAESFPGWEVRRAFTSRPVIRILEGRGIHVDFVDAALDRLADEGYGTVVVQPTLVMNGVEYDYMMEEVDKRRDRFDAIAVGRPLLTTSEDFDALIEAIESAYGPEAEDDAMVLMGHGTTHFANSAYSELQLRIIASGRRDVYVTTVEGFPNYESTLDLMKDGGRRDVVMFPLMIVAGDHANNDLAGDDVMIAAGYNPRCVVRGMGEYPEFRDLFRAHAADAIASLSRRSGPR